MVKSLFEFRSGEGHPEKRSFQPGLCSCHSNQSVPQLHPPPAGHLQRDTLPPGAHPNRPPGQGTQLSHSSLKMIATVNYYYQ